MVTSSTDAKHGQFCWMQGDERRRYVEKLRAKISSGYYSSDKIASDITDKLARSFEVELDKLLK